MDLDDLIDARAVADLIGLTHRNGVYTYRGRHPDFPQPVIIHGRCYMWYRPDIVRWIRHRRQGEVRWWCPGCGDPDS